MAETKPNRQQTQQRGMARHQPQSSMTPYSPFSMMDRFREEMDRLFEDFGLGSWFSPGRRSAMMPRTGPQGQTGVWSPQIEIYEKENNLIVRADLPGLKKDDVRVHVYEDTLTIEGERKQEHEEEREGFYRSERAYGSFFRSIPIPAEVDPDQVKATFSDGVLELRIPYPEERAARQIQIQDRGEPEGNVRIGESGRTGETGRTGQSGQTGQMGQSAQAGQTGQTPGSQGQSGRTGQMGSDRQGEQRTGR